MTTENPINDDETPITAELSDIGTQAADTALDHVGQDEPVAEKPPAETAEAPEAAPEAAPAPVAEAPAPAPAAPAVPQAQAIDQQRLADIDRREADLQYREAMGNLDAQVGQYETRITNEYLATGLYTQEQSQMMARQNADIQKQAYVAQMQAKTEQQQEVAVQKGQFKAALYYAKRYKVDAEDLLQYQSPQAMEAASKSTSRIAELESRLTKQERAAVPPQQMDDSRPAPAAVTSYENDLTRYINGARDESASKAGRASTGG